MTFVAPERTATGDFVLRSYLPGDGAALQEATVASYAHLKPWMPWATTGQTVEQAERLVRQFRAAYLTSRDFVVAAFDPTGARLIGGTGFHLRGGPLDARQAEVGMWVREGHAGRGLGTAMLREMVRWGFAEWPWLRISWHCNTENVRSRRVAEKSGLRLEGVHRGMFDDVSGGRRDMAVYAILRDEAG